MKARVFRIVVAAQFNDELDPEFLARAIMNSLQSTNLSPGVAKISVVPLQDDGTNFEEPLPPASALN